MPFVFAALMKPTAEVAFPKTFVPGVALPEPMAASAINTKLRRRQIRERIITAAGLLVAALGVWCLVNCSSVNQHDIDLIEKRAAWAFPGFVLIVVGCRVGVRAQMRSLAMFHALSPAPKEVRKATREMLAHTPGGAQFSAKVSALGRDFTGEEHAWAVAHVAAWREANKKRAQSEERAQSD